MKRICPNPIPWHEAFERLTEFARKNKCDPSEPPKPLILSAWAYTNDLDKMRRWQETVAWADKNQCTQLTSEIRDSEFYFASEPSSYDIGPLGGPMYLPWTFNSKIRPNSEAISQYLQILKSRWPEIVGTKIARITRPLAFTGNKSRRLVVCANGSSQPPWGDWAKLSDLEAERRTFTQLRNAINKSIAPHEVDHIDFTIED